MFGIGRLAAALILGIVILGARAEAQDTSFMDMNMNMGCMLMAGMHEMQLSVYQAGALDDSCPAIPYPGAAVVTLTAVSKELRDMTAEVRIVRGAEADAAAGAGLAPITLAYLPPKIYPTGVITLPANFDQPGKYAVLGDGQRRQGHDHVRPARRQRRAGDAQMGICFCLCRNCSGGVIRLLFLGSKS